MAEYISFQPSDFFSSIPFVGNTGGVPTTVTGVGFQPDLCWFKNREVVNDFWLFDAVRGVEEYLESNTTQIETTDAQGLQSFNADGFTVGTANPINQNTKNIISWNWKAGTTSGITGGTITPSSYSFNTTSGFSIVKYGGNGTSGATVPHGLGVIPQLMIVKRTDVTDSWQVYSSASGATKYIQLDDSGAEATSTGRWNDTAPTSTLFSIGDANPVNNSSGTYIAYVFANVKGYSKFGSYTGTGNVDGAFVYTGFSPAYVCVKKTNGTASWTQSGSGISFNGTGTNNSNVLRLDTTGVESNEYSLQRFSNGFGFKGADGGSGTVNGSGDTYVYMAFAEFPIVSSNDIPAVAQ